VLEDALAPPETPTSQYGDLRSRRRRVRGGLPIDRGRRNRMGDLGRRSSQRDTSCRGDQQGAYQEGGSKGRDLPFNAFATRSLVSSL